MEAIILAGGFGKRLQYVVKDIPKPMADINGIPFLEYVIRYLIKYGVTKVVIAVSYKKEAIMDYFKDKYQGIDIEYSIEDTPLGTGGGIKKAMDLCTDPDIFILNGDTFFDIDLSKMMDFHAKSNADITIASKLMQNFDRYGTLGLEKNGKVLSFIEKQSRESGYINGGIYIMKKSILGRIEKDNFSIEKDFMEDKSLKLDIYAYISNGYFIDIGIPEDYFKAQKDFEEGNISR